MGFHTPGLPAPMTICTRFSAPRRAAALAIAGMTVLASVHGASADEGLGGFLQSIFGGGASQQPAAPVYRQPEGTTSDYRGVSPRYARPSYRKALTVRLHRARPSLTVAQVPTKPGKVPIYEDPTLRRGDAVMTAEGIRVFAGSTSWPYTKADFIDLTAAKDLSKDTVKVLAEVNRLPRG